MDEPGPDLDGEQQVAARLRDLADRLAAHEVDGPTLDRLVVALDVALGEVPHPATPSSRFARAYADAAAEGRDEPAGGHPLGRGASGIYPPFTLRADGERRLVAETTFGPAWEGPPGLVHGGFLTAGFDMVFSTLAGRLLGPSVTRWLRTRFLKPTFLGAALRYEVVADEQRGRLVDLRGELFADDRITMRATAQFASLTSTRFADRRVPPT